MDKKKVMTHGDSPVTLPQRHSSPCDAEGREHRGWEKGDDEVTANHIVSAGESDKTQHFSPPFCTFNAQTARNLQTFLYLCTRYNTIIRIMVDLKNPKWEDFHISDMPKHVQKPLTAERIARNLKIQRVHQMARAISRVRKQAGYTSTKPQSKVIRAEEMPKELFDKFLGNVQQ